MKCFSTVLLLMVPALSGALATDSLDVYFAAESEQPSAILLLCPGMNGDGRFFFSEQPWVDFAAEHNLALATIAFRSDVDGLYGPERRGYYWPEQGSGEAVLNAIRDEFGEDLPILIYGFSGGAQFASRFVEWVPERVVVWAAYSAQFWDPPMANGVMPPGIVACGDEDGIRYHPSFAYFYQGRELGRPWTWVSLGDTGHRRHRELEVFVRDYFAAVLKGKERVDEAVVLDFELMSAPESWEQALQPGLTVWLPNETVAERWKELHKP